MNKDNVFKSSDFFMAEGDVLHILIEEESGTPAIFNLTNAESLNTTPNPPTVAEASDITSSSFVANWYWNEDSDGYYIDVAEDSAFTSLVVDNVDVGNVISYSVIGLTAGFLYYYRLRAYNDTGTSTNSDTVDTQTLALTGDITDIDGNIYTSVIIGDQEWLVENLKTTTYGDGTPIPNITDDALWGADVTGAYAWYNNDMGNKTPYGALYNWYAMDNAHGLAYIERGGVQEVGWRMPTHADMATLVALLGGAAVAGGEVKEAGLTHWQTPNTGATNSTGLTVLPAGTREQPLGWIFIDMGQFGYIPVSDGAPFMEAYLLQYSNATLMSFSTGYSEGLSVRLMRDI